MLAPPMRRHRLIAVVFLALLAGAALLAAPGTAKRPPAQRLVLAPRSGHAYPAKPLAVRIRAPRRARVTVRLNGSVTRSGFVRRHRGRVRVLEASPSHGLRHGRNLLRVRVRRPGAKRARTATVRFRVVGNRPLAAAGRDRRLLADTRIRLDGRGSRPHPQARQAGVELDHRWTVLRAPQASELAPRRRSRGNRRPADISAGPPALLAAPGSPEPSFRPDVPGTYVLQLRVDGPRGQAGSDRVTLRVDPPPLVPIDTMARQSGKGPYGIRVGSEFYPDPGASKGWLQVLVLRERNLELVSNQSYDCPLTTTNSAPTKYALKVVETCVKRLRVDIQRLRGESDRYLVFAVSQRPDDHAVGSGEAWKNQPPVGAWGALSPIAGPGYPYNHTDLPMLRARLSFIGKAGEGHGRPLLTHDNNELAEVRDDGQIVGSLLRDNFGNYSTYSSFEHLSFDTQAEGSDRSKNVMRIGDNTVTQPIGEGGGFHLVVAERRDLTPTSYWFPTGNGNLSTQQQIDLLNKMRGVLSDVSKDWRSGLIFLATRGDSRLRVPRDNHPSALNTAAQQLVDVLSQQYGASRNTVYRALDPHLSPEAYRSGRGEWSYTLVSRVGTPPGEAMEDEGGEPMKGGAGLALNSVPYAGSLTRSAPSYNFDFEDGEEGDAFEGPGMKLRDTALSAPGAWPEQGDPGREAAVRGLTEAVGLDSRRAYLWTRGANFDWKPLIKAIEDVRYPGGSPGYSSGDLDWAERELVEEIGWLETTRSFAADLAEPFARGQLPSWAAFSKVAADVNGKVDAPLKDKTGAKLLLLVDATRDLAEELPEPIDKIAGIVNVLYDTGMEWAKIDAEGTEAGEPFSVTVGEVGEDLAKRLEAVRGTLTDQLVQVVASDYRKLRTVGLCAGNLPSCPDKPVADWQMTRDDQQQAARTVNVAARMLAYQVLMPAKYDAWAPPATTWRSTNFNGWQPAGEAGAVWFCPFRDLPLSAQSSSLMRRGIGSTTGWPDTWQVYAYAERGGDGILTNPFEMRTPPASVTDPIFAKVSAGGLGGDRETFFLRGWGAGRPGQIRPFSSPDPFATPRIEGFPLVDSPVRWISKDDPFGPKASSCGY